MRVVWNELTPNDRYLVRTIRPISMAEMGFIAHLYLPLIGVASHSLYQLLTHEVDERSGAIAEGTHRSLMLMTSLPLDRFLAARERLEAMGLVEVRRRENRDRDYFFEYIVKPPLAPGQFFHEDIWPVMLLNQVGKARYEQIRRRFTDLLGSGLESEYPYEENITKRFYEVYHTLSASEVEVRPGTETELFLSEISARYPLPTLDTQYESEADPTFDLSFIRLCIPSEIDVASVMTTENIEFLYKLISFYQLNSWLLGQELRDWNLYIQDRELNRDALRKRCLEKYVDHKLNRAQATHVPESELSPGNLPAPGTESFIRICRQLSPLILLEQAIGGHVGKAYLERAESLFFTDNLPAEVVNALLLHTMRETKMELPKAYLETVRDSWKAKQVSTAAEAVGIILERNEARSQAQEKAANRPTRKETSATPKQRRGGRAIMEDQLPASVQRQLEREKEQEKLAELNGAAPPTPKKTIMDDPEMRELYESLEKLRKEGER